MRRSLPSADQMVQTPSSAAVSEIIGPAGSDMQILPPTVAVFQILKEARKARQHWPISGAAIQSTGGGKAVELRDGAGGGDVEPVCAGLQRLPAEGGEIDQPRQPRLRLGKQPGAAGEPGIAGAPGRQVGARARPRHFADRVQVHGNAYGLSRGTTYSVHCRTRSALGAASAGSSGNPVKRTQCYPTWVSAFAGTNGGELWSRTCRDLYGAWRKGVRR